jgi:hypothetical protein
MHSSVEIRNSVRDNAENISDCFIADSSFLPIFLEQWDKNHVHLGVLKLTITPKVNKDSLSHLPRGSLRSFDKTKLRQSTGSCGEGRLSPLTFP